MYDLRNILSTFVDWTFKQVLIYSNMDIPIKKLYRDTKMPLRAKDGDAAFDCFVHHFISYAQLKNEMQIVNTNPFRLLPHETIGCALGFSTAIPHGYYANIVPRSGLALKHNVIAILGTIDAGYRGEWIAIINNFGNDVFEIWCGDRICQIMVKKLDEYVFTETEELPTSERGSNGFGSTGK